MTKFWMGAKVKKKINHPRSFIKTNINLCESHLLNTCNFDFKSTYQKPANQLTHIANETTNIHHQPSQQTSNSENGSSESNPNQTLSSANSRLSDSDNNIQHNPLDDDKLFKDANSSCVLLQPLH